MSELAQAAIAYAQRGWPVFPCQPRAKVPLTTHGLHDATTDPEKVAAWWKRCPDANIAMPTGRQTGPGIVVVDVDGDDGYASLRELEREHGELPRTASVKTPRGGEHYYLCHPGAHVPNSAGALGAGIDVRGDGGYVLAPPSVGANGHAYEPDEQAPIQPPPGWLARRLASINAARRVVREPAETWIRMVRDGLTSGERNMGLTRFVGHLMARGVDVRLVWEIAALVNERARPPLPADDVERIVMSIAGRELRRRRRQR